MPFAADLPANCPVELVVVAGQSNALGYTLHRGDVPAALRAPMARAFIWDVPSQAFAPLTPGVNTGSPNNPESWGPEAQFAYRWQAAHPCGALYVVKHARGETGLALDATERDWSPEAQNELWAEATRQVQAAQAALRGKGLKPHADVVLWMQGETDAQRAAKAKAYERNLAAFVQQVRTSWGDAETEILIGQIDLDGSAGARTVRAAQAAVAQAAPNVGVTDTDPFPRQPADGVHLTAAGQVALGDAFYDAPPD